MRVFKKKPTTGILAVFFILAATLFSHGSSGETGVNTDTDDVYKNIELFTKVLRQVEENYVEPKGTKKLIEGAIKGMMESLDPHSTYMTKEEHDDLRVETQGSFTGVGMQITLKDDLLTVISAIEDTPAYKAGIKSGDRILKIDEKTAIDMTSTEAVKLIRGPKGSTVKITISRKGVNKPLVFNLTRDVIPLQSVRSYRLNHEIGYVRITNFQGNTTEELLAALEKLEKERPLKGLILDLRDNPGGLLIQAIEVSDIFLESGAIVSTKGRIREQDIIESATRSPLDRKWPMVVVVSGGSASASEIVAGALQDNKRALILGTKTFGKGSVQTILPLSDGSGLRLTTARYYTPSGRSIQVSGINPDIELEYAPIEEKDEEEVSFFIREADLDNHMINEDGDTENPAPAIKEKPASEGRKQNLEKLPETNKAGQQQSEAEKIERGEEEKNEDTLYLERLEKDNQIKMAVQVLKSWGVIQQIESGGTPDNI
ncbi:MAG: S41 family peptidase [Deltaproteobacteria bacterium]|nr:S41 family peptidase [Deltaproteobacteria bacterium]